MIRGGYTSFEGHSTSKMSKNCSTDTLRMRMGKGCSRRIQSELIAKSSHPFCETVSRRGSIGQDSGIGFGELHLPCDETSAGSVHAQASLSPDSAKRTLSLTTLWRIND